MYYICIVACGFVFSDIVSEFQVTCRSYAWSQLLSRWTVTHAKQPHVHIKTELANSTAQNVDELKGLSCHVRSDTHNVNES